MADAEVSTWARSAGVNRLGKALDEGLEQMHPGKAHCRGSGTGVKHGTAGGWQRGSWSGEANTAALDSNDERGGDARAEATGAGVKDDRRAGDGRRGAGAEKARWCRGRDTPPRWWSRQQQSSEHFASADGGPRRVCARAWAGAAHSGANANTNSFVCSAIGKQPLFGHIPTHRVGAVLIGGEADRPMRQFGA